LALIRTKAPAPLLRLYTDNSIHIVIRKHDGQLLLDVESLHNDALQIRAELRTDQAKLIAEVLQNG